MPRELRNRKNRPSYANLFPTLTDDEDLSRRREDSDDDNDVKVKNPPRAESEASGSDFAPPSAEESLDDKEEDMMEDGDEDEDNSIASEEGGSVLEVSVEEDGRGVAPWAITLGSGPAEHSKLKTLPAPPRYDGRQTTIGLSTSRPSKSSSAAVASTLHRDRPWPAWVVPSRTFRLKSFPVLFQNTSPEIICVTNASLDERKSVRLAKAWSHDVGYGPVWELVEDRGWFKEAKSLETLLSEAQKGLGDSVLADVSTPSDILSHCHRLRPTCYSQVTVDLDLKVLSKQEATRFLPSKNEDGMGFSIPCHFGPFDAQVQRDVKLFDVYKMSQFFEGSSSHVFHAGAPVWGIDWCPISEEAARVRSNRQYLAVAPFPSYEYSPAIGSRVQRPYPSCIQIWSFGPSTSDLDKEDTGDVQCEMVICTESGPAYQLKWCPLPSHDPWSLGKVGSAPTRKLGILGGIFGDGSLSFYAVPDPEDIKSRRDGSSPSFVYLKEPLLRIELEDAPFWCFDWANSELIAAGCTNGNIALYHVKGALESGSTAVLLPSLYMQVHQAAIRSVAWIRIPPSDGKGKEHVNWDPTTLCTVSYDGSCVLVDTREQWPQEMFRSRDTINSVIFSPWCGGPITIEGETAVKWYSMLPHVLGRGHGVLQSSGPVWALSGSDYHPYLASASTDGSCCTTNVFKATRRRGKLPLFVHKIYQMDFNRTTKEWRMLENFLPSEIAESRATKTINKTKKAKSGSRVQAPSDNANQAAGVGGSGAWPPEVGVHCVSWNSSNGLTKCQLLASGTASGLCRIDNLWGRFRKGHVPYGGVEVLRGEVGVAAGEEEESDEED